MRGRPALDQAGGVEPVQRRAPQLGAPGVAGSAPPAPAADLDDKQKLPLLKYLKYRGNECYEILCPVKTGFRL